MWLPDSVYKPAPYYWMVLGVFFVALGTFRASQGDFVIGSACFAAGVASCVWSLRVALRRRSRDQVAYQDLDLDQTCELNYRPD
ncbi:MAG: hypothetical protein R3315_05130 [Woeseiaceae bacterium]|nr:hypothetical protein [Woeseiaceae bacterium]